MMRTLFTQQETGSPSAGFDRHVCLALCFLVGFAVLLFRLFDLQVLRADTMTEKARRQHEQVITLDSNRGAILDRRGRPLALNRDALSVYATPAAIHQPAVVARQLAQALDVPSAPLEARLRSTRDFVWIQRKISDDRVERVNNLALPGVSTLIEARRFYPKGTMLAHVLGFAGMDSQGLEGVESGYDRHLRGHARRVVRHRDALGRVIIPPIAAFGNGTDGRLPGGVSGHAVVLTIDEVVQHIAEQALERAVRDTHARGGAILVMDPITGGILAWTLRPTFDPNHIRDATPDRWRNRMITDPYEPGSTLKVVLSAAALAMHRVEPNTLLYAGDGAVPIRGTVIHDHATTGWVTFREAVRRSSNVAFVKMSLALGEEPVYRFLRAFGFGEKTGIDLTGESVGILRRPEQWSRRTLPSLAIGQEIAVTPLQMVTAVAAVANQGWLMRPFLVREITDGDGRVVWTQAPKIRRRPIDAATAKTVTELLVDVVEHGTGRRAAIPGYRVAGKTGTAQKIDPATGMYSSTKAIGSFVGFVPAEAPRLAVLVLIDEPEGPSWGGVVAAPVFRAVAEQTLHYLHVAPHAPPRAARMASATNPASHDAAPTATATATADNGDDHGGGNDG